MADASAADEGESSSNGANSILQEFTFKDKGREFVVSSQQLESGEHQVIVRSNFSAAPTFTLSHIVLIGRTLDANKFIPDVWFYFDAEGGIHSVVKEVKNRIFGYDLKELVKDVLHTELDRVPARWLSWLIFESIMNTISMAAREHFNFADEIFLDQAEVLLAEKRVSDQSFLRLALEHPELVDWQLDSIAMAWKDIRRKIEMHKQSYWSFAAADVAAFIVIRKLAGLIPLNNWLAKQSSLVNSKINPLMQKFVESWKLGFLQKITQKVSQPLAKPISQASFQMALKTLGVQTLSSLNGLQRLRALSQFLTTKSRFVGLTLSGVQKALGITGYFLKHATSLKSLQGITATGTITIVSQYLKEINKDKILSHDPVVIKREVFDAYKRMNQNPENRSELISSMLKASLALGTFSSLQAQGVSYLKRILMVGFVSAGSSVSMDLYRQKPTDVKKLAWDTGWSLILSNFQFHGLYPTMMSRLETFSSNMELRRLMVVGYLVQVVDQAYWSYTKDKYYTALLNQPQSDIMMASAEVQNKDINNAAAEKAQNSEFKLASMRQNNQNVNPIPSSVSTMQATSIARSRLSGQWLQAPPSSQTVTGILDSQVGSYSVRLIPVVVEQ